MASSAGTALPAGRSSRHTEDQMRDPKPNSQHSPVVDTARDVAGDSAAASPRAQEAEGDAALGNDLSPNDARGIPSNDTGPGTSDGQAEREDTVDARDVAGDTRGASR